MGIIELIFVTIGGCCSNVFSFEKILDIEKNITTIITFSQYVFIYSFIALYLKFVKYWSPNNTSFRFEKEFLIPIILQSVSGYLGNLVFKLNLSMPTHIIFRSSSTAITILMGLIFYQKKYKLNKILGSLLIGIGVMLFTIDMNYQNSQIKDDHDPSSNQNYGIFLLLLATIINSYSSLYKERIYQNPENKSKIDWKEVLYYNYLYGILIYLPFINEMVSEWEISKGTILADHSVLWLILGNWITQLVCILGVNLLVFKVNALTLTVVLLIRRFLSLILSIYIFDNKIGNCGILGAFIVFIGAFVYSI